MTRGQFHWRDILHFPKFDHNWNLTTKLSSVISMTLYMRVGVLTLCREAVGVFYSPSLLGNKNVNVLRFSGERKQNVWHGVKINKSIDINKSLLNNAIIIPMRKRDYDSVYFAIKRNIYFVTVHVIDLIEITLKCLKIILYLSKANHIGHHGQLAQYKPNDFIMFVYICCC